MLRLSMIVKNEESRYLRPVLESARKYITDAVIIDDASTDGTVALCKELLANIPHRIIENKESQFSNEWLLRQQQWDESTKDNPDWLIFLDADEIVEDAFAEVAETYTTQTDADVISFRLYDFWNETHYREDALWNAHSTYKAFMLRYHPDFLYQFTQTSQHCGRMPSNIYQQPNAISQYRIKHLGWSKEEDRIAKYHRYKRLDPHGIHGSLAQYESILDESPNLVKWVE